MDNSRPEQLTSPRVGIDLGTTNSVMAMVQGGVGVRFIRNKDGAELTPSWVTLCDGAWFVGETGRNMAAAAPHSSYYSIKRLIGRNFRDPNVQRVKAHLPYRLRGVTEDGEGILVGVPADGDPSEERLTWVRPQTLSARVLAKMKSDAEELDPSRSFEKAVITVPAHFMAHQISATLEAGIEAGLQVLAILPEPMAAAYAYGLTPEALSQTSETLLVFDLGGGTFDVTIMDVQDGEFHIIGLEGDMWLGGDDFDRVIQDIIEAELRAKGVEPKTSPESQMEIKELAEKTKRMLGEAQHHDVHHNFPNLRTRLMGKRVTRAEFEQGIKPLVDRALALTERALTESGLRPEDIDHVLLVGGSTRVPYVQQRVRALFGADKVRATVLDPMRAVAEGAALYAARVPDGVQCPHCQKRHAVGTATCPETGLPLSPADSGPDDPTDLEWTCPAPSCGAMNPGPRDTCQVCGQRRPGGGGIAAVPTPFAYGVRLQDGTVATVIEKQTLFPMDEFETRRFATHAEYARVCDVSIFCGNAATASECEFVGRVLVDFGKPVPRGTELMVSLKLDRSAMLDVSVHAGGEIQRARMTTPGDEFFEANRKISALLDAAQSPEARGFLQRAQADLATAAFSPSLSRDSKRQLAGEAEHLVVRAAETLARADKLHTHPGVSEDNRKLAHDVRQRLLDVWPEATSDKRRQAIDDACEQLESIPVRDVEMEERLREHEFVAEFLKNLLEPHEQMEWESAVAAMQRSVRAGNASLSGVSDRELRRLREDLNFRAKLALACLAAVSHLQDNAQRMSFRARLGELVRRRAPAEEFHALLLEIRDVLEKTGGGGGGGGGGDDIGGVVEF